MSGRRLYFVGFYKLSSYPSINNINQTSGAKKSYVVKEVYWALSSLQLQEQQAMDNDAFRCFWSIKIPFKARTFV